MDTSSNINNSNKGKNKTLFVLLGPTGVGKTAQSLSIAQMLQCPIINADSRQIYKEIPIGTAAPSAFERQLVQHYFVGTLSLTQTYSAAVYEHQVLELLHHLFDTHDNLLLTGGSMLYIDAVCKGIDTLPTILPEIRQSLLLEYQEKGADLLIEELRLLDPIGAEYIDINNPRRVLHALEICRQTGHPYSSFLTRKVQPRPFRIVKIGLLRSRASLYERIDRRVDIMLHQGLIEETRKVYPQRHLNALNTVGYKELFTYFDGRCTLQEALQKIKSDTHQYCRKQTTWFSHDSSIVWFDADSHSQILHFVQEQRNIHSSNFCQMYFSKNG